MARLSVEFIGERVRTSTACSCPEEGPACRPCRESRLSIRRLYRQTSDQIEVVEDVGHLVEPTEAEIIADLAGWRHPVVTAEEVFSDVPMTRDFSATKPGRWQVIR